MIKSNRFLEPLPSALADGEKEIKQQKAAYEQTIL